MIKSYLLVVSLCLTLLMGSYQSKVYIRSSSQIMAVNLQALSSSVQQENWQKAQTEFADVKAQWEKTKKSWAILLHHEEIDNIDIALARTEKYVEREETALSLGEIAVLVLLVEHVAEMDRISWENIL